MSLKTLWQAGDQNGLVLFFYRILFAALMVGGWEFVSGRYVDAFLISKPSQIAWELWQGIQSGSLLKHTSISLSNAFTGFPFGALGGIGAGFLLARLGLLAKVIDPFILAIYGVPRIALAPLFIFWFGIGPMSKIMLVVMMVFFLTFFNTYAGVRSVDLELKNIARVMGANERQMLFKVVLPSAAPWIFTGLKISVPYGLVGALVGEFMASSKGLGYKIMRDSNLFNPAGVMAGIITIMVIVIALNLILAKVEGHVLRWRPQELEGRSSTGM